MAASLLLIAVSGSAFGQHRAISPDPFLEAESHASAPAQSPPTYTEPDQWSAIEAVPEHGSARASREPAELLPPIYSPDEDPAAVLQPVTLEHEEPSQAGGLLRHSTDTFGDEAIREANATLQSPEFSGAPNPTPIEAGSQPPSYTFLPDPEPAAPVQPNYLFQKSSFIGTWLPAGSNEIGMFDFDMQSSLVAPALAGWSLTPGFQVHFLDGPTRTDLPEQLYNARIELGWMKQLNPRVGLQLAVAPGVYSDFQQGSSNAFRITGKALGFYGISPQTQLLLGIAYLDREDIKVLPAFGVIHTPSPDYRFELVFPKPKIAYRLSQVANAATAGGERWVYLTGEFGGGSWAIERATGAADVATYSDWRLIVGMESKAPTGPGWLVEVGIVFKRQLEYQSGNGDFDPNSTGMLRAGLTY